MSELGCECLALVKTRDDKLKIFMIFLYWTYSIVVDNSILGSRWDCLANFSCCPAVTSEVNLKQFYLLLYSIALRSLLLWPFPHYIWQIWCHVFEMWNIDSCIGSIVPQFLKQSSFEHSYFLWWFPEAGWIKTKHVQTLIVLTMIQHTMRWSNIYIYPIYLLSLRSCVVVSEGVFVFMTT